MTLIPRTSTARAAGVLTLALALGAATSAAAQTTSRPARAPRPTGRLAFYTTSMQFQPDGVPATTLNEFVTSITFHAPDVPESGLEYGIDLRDSRYNDPTRTPRQSLYDAYFGGRVAGGHLMMRGGQMWISDIGGLGAIIGAQFEYREPRITRTAGRIRIGGFYGYEPKAFELGYLNTIRKMGGYAALEGTGGRRFVAGYVRLTDGGLLERSVVTTTNFLPVKSKVFVYQAAEYDLAGPAGQGAGGLTYLLVNGRVAPSRRVDVQGIYHRGRSIDTRSITDDVLNGRPLRPGALDALLYSSMGSRLTVEVVRGVRLNAGYTRDQNNRESETTSRQTYGGYAADLARTGFDLSVTESITHRPAGSTYTSLYVSAGHMIGRTVYVTGDYSTAVSVARFTGLDGLTIETKPKTQQLSVSGNINVGRQASILTTVERTRDDTSSDLRVLAGISYRFR